VLGRGEGGWEGRRGGGGGTNGGGGEGTTVHEMHASALEFLNCAWVPIGWLHTTPPHTTATSARVILPIKDSFVTLAFAGGIQGVCVLKNNIKVCVGQGDGTSMSDMPQFAQTVHSCC
jgi:hypothetical protein